MKQPDREAILALIALAALLAAGAITLIGLGRPVPDPMWPVITGTIGVVGGWVGRDKVDR